MKRGIRERGEGERKREREGSDFPSEYTLYQS